MQRRRCRRRRRRKKGGEEEEYDRRDFTFGWGKSADAAA